MDLSTVVFDVPWRSNSLSVLALCPNLKELNLRNFRAGVPQLKFLTRHCKDIESITLSLSRLTKNCNDSFLENHFISKFNLRRLHLISPKEKIKGHCLRNLSPDFIEEIFLENCSSFDLKLMISVIVCFINYFFFLSI